MTGFLEAIGIGGVTVGMIAALVAVGWFLFHFVRTAIMEALFRCGLAWRPKHPRRSPDHWYYVIPYKYKETTRYAPQLMVIFVKFVAVIGGFLLGLAVLGYAMAYFGFSP